MEEIDEISTVDIPANQHGLIAIAKRAGDHGMDEYFDEQGNPVDIDDVDVGQVVFDADGTPFRMQTPEAIDDAIAAGELDPADVVDLDAPADDDEFEPDDPRLSYDDEGADDGELVGAVGKRGGRGATRAHGRGASAVSGGAGSQVAVGRRRQNLGQPIGKRGLSEGQQILSELRKALTDADRDEIISKAFDRVGEAEERAERAERIAKGLLSRVEGAEYVELAKSYDALPVEAGELGGLLRQAASTFSKRQLATLERILEVAQDGGVALDELGVSGYQSSGSGVHDEVEAMAHEVVGKAGNLTHEQAMTELYSANPEAYDAYEAERYTR